MKVLHQIIIISCFLTLVSCATAGSTSKVKYTRNTAAPDAAYEYVGKIYLGGQVMAGGGKVVNSSPFGGFSEEHAIAKMRDMAEDAGANYLIIESIRETGYGDQIRYLGVGSAYRLRESFGSAGKIILTEKGHMVQYVIRMEPGPDYSPIASLKADNGSISGPKGDVSAIADSEEEAIITMRNIAADLGASLLVVDSINKDDTKKPSAYEGKGRIFKLKTKP